MNFIWDISLQAKRDGFPFSDIFFIPSDSCSPYYEPSLDFINQRHIEDSVVEINPLYRFAGIFQYLLHPDFIGFVEEESQQFMIFMFDVMVHILAEVDLCHGMTTREFYVRQVRRDLRDGVYGESAREAVLVMDDEMQLSVADELLNVMYEGSSIASFCHIMRQVFHGCIVYQNRRHPQIIYAYIGKERTEALEKRWKLLKDTFLPLDAEVRVFWDIHFGIMGVDGTMRPDRIAIF